jgi:radical SAM-linked protein
MTLEKTRLRIRFTKSGDLRWISHRDLARLWERLLRRANLQLAFSQGFHPKPRISFPSALALGIEALDEIVELEVVGAFDLQRIEEDIRQEMPVGMELLELTSPTYALGKAKVVGASYRVQITTEERAQTADRIKELLSLKMIEIVRDEKIVTCDPQDAGFELRVEDNAGTCSDRGSINAYSLIFSLPSDADGSVRPLELLECIGLPDLLSDGATLARTRVHLNEPQANR